MSATGRHNAEARANALLARCNVTTAPTPVDQLAAAVGARVVRQPMDKNTSGMTYRHDGVVVIGLNSDHHPRRQRFTQAHEIGHVELHPGRPLTVDSSIRVNFRDDVSSQATDREEIEANAYAAALLMPEPLVLLEVIRLQDAGTTDRTRLTSALAKTFDVSPEAMGFRLLNLGIISAI